MQQLLPQSVAPGRAHEARLQLGLRATRSREPQLREEHVPVQLDRGARVRAQELHQSALRQLLRLVEGVARQVRGRRRRQQEVGHHAAHDGHHLVQQGLVHLPGRVRKPIASGEHLHRPERGDQQASVPEALRREVEVEGEELKHDNANKAHEGASDAAAHQECEYQLPDEGAHRDPLEAAELLHEGGASGSVEVHDEHGTARGRGAVASDDAWDPKPADAEGQGEAH
mmetsp:Transcript_103171/g.272661  ORF Transcript_103171/g.272661 Transcript_103171/m.272661 type:complete len:228 (-) Transcript_103171:365-1048(-)